jgi:aldose 1-epimerase
MHDLTLSRGGWTATIRPQCGGVIASLAKGDVDVLQRMPEGSSNPLESACFPMVPFCNRIADGRFVWLGDEVHLPANFPPDPHGIHGMGWQSEWQVASADEWRCTLVHEYAGLGDQPWGKPVTRWPWAYRAEQRIRLGGRGMKITLDLTNRSNAPMPAGLGLHPYFRRSSDTRVTFSSRGMVQVDERQIPTEDFLAADTVAPWHKGTVLPDRLVDHCFVGWNEEARIEDALGTIHLRASGAPNLHLYAPTDGKTLCLEPVSHIPDAANQDPAGMIALPPGCTASLHMEIGAKP